MRIPIRRPLLAVTLVLTVGTAVAGDPPYYQKKNTWHETVLASRMAMAAYTVESLTAQGIRLTPWYVIGPFVADNPFETAFGPERAVDLDKTGEGGKLRWAPRAEWLDGEVTSLPEVDRSANYLFRRIVAPRETTVTFYFGSDDGIQVWLNGPSILRHDIARGCARNQEIVSAQLRVGPNELLMKITNGNGPTGFYFSLFDLDPATIWNLAERDFPGEAAREEMRWEQTDGIWQGQVRMNNYDDLALRYRSATATLARSIETDFLPTGGFAGSEEELWKARTAYLRIRRKEKEVRRQELNELTMTPKPSPKPRINGPAVFGVRPGAPFHYTIPATGTRPMEFSLKNSPRGLRLDRESGQITGAIAKGGRYEIVLGAKNGLGRAEKKLTIVVGDTIGLTPPLGWNSWNCFASDVDDAKIRAAAEAMVKSGLVEHGWSYINIDDCWMVKPEAKDSVLGGVPRDGRGMIRTNRKFPDMKSLSEYVHSLGLRLGIYSSPGPLTCAGYAGSYSFELQDARQYAEWGIDYLKYDWCSYGRIAKDQGRAELKKPYTVMRNALSSVSRDIVYSLCQYGMGNVWEWGTEVGGNCWRTTGDITDTWESMSGIGFGQAGLEKYAGPGHWNDPDMLVVGWVGWGPKLHPTRLTPHEQVTHITLWSLLASPLLIGCDMTRLDDFTLALLTNDEVLDVHQDPLGKQAARVAVRGDHEVWAKPLEDGTVAVGLFNRGEKRGLVSLKWEDLQIKGRRIVRDLWRQKDVGTFDGEFTVEVGRHGAAMIRLRGPR